MTAMHKPAALAGAIPPRPVTIHKGDHAAVTFDGYGTVTATGPRRAELAGMVAALPLILRQLAAVTQMLRQRDGNESPHVISLEDALAEAGITADAPIPSDEVPPMSMTEPASPAERFALLLATIAESLDGILADPKTRTLYGPTKEALRNTSHTIRRVLRQNGYGPAGAPEQDQAAATDSVGGVA